MSFFSIENVAFQLLGYNMSWLELVATFAGLLAVWLSAKEHIATWGIGLVNVILSAFIFYQSSLYSDMFLQAYFFATGIYGWWLWGKRDQISSDLVVKVSFLRRNQQILTVLFIIISTALVGNAMSHIHEWLPKYFPNPAAFPYWDTLIMMMSVVANLLLTVKKVESWLLWVAVDVIAPILYFQKGVILIAFEYVIFLIIATFALVNWLKIHQKQKITEGVVVH